MASHIPLGFYKHLANTNERCRCCGEDVGKHDAKEIHKQLENREKNCMWCGYDFELTEEEIVSILNGEGDVELEEVAKALNRQSNYIIAGNHNADTVFFDVETQNGPEENTPEYEESRKMAILQVYGIDTDKEKFDPGYADKHGNPRDRIVDGIAYEEIRKDNLAHRMLKYVKDNPECNITTLRKKSMHCKISKYKRLSESPIARMIASDLLECTSEFAGLYKVGDKKFISRYFGKIPRFKRKFTITKHGEGVLAEFDKGKDMVLL